METWQIPVCFGYPVPVSHGNPESTWTLFPKADGVSIQKTLGTNFFTTIAIYRQNGGRSVKPVAGTEGQGLADKGEESLATVSAQREQADSLCPRALNRDSVF